jgi:hypothetical protein
VMIFNFFFTYFTFSWEKERKKKMMEWMNEWMNDEHHLKSSSDNYDDQRKEKETKPNEIKHDDYLSNDD